MTGNASPPDSLDASAGTVTVSLNNADEVAEFTIGALGVDETAQSGQEATVQLDPEPATYDFVCTFHPGMAGTLTVSE